MAERRRATDLRLALVLTFHGQHCGVIDMNRELLKTLFERRFDEDLVRLRSLRTSKARMNATAIVEDAARVTHPNSPLLQRSMVREWRRTGGDAHGLGRGLMTQSVAWGDRGSDGLTAAVAEVDLVSLANGYLAAWLVLKRAFMEAAAAAQAAKWTT